MWDLTYQSFLCFRFAMKTNTHIRKSANMNLTKNVMKNTKRSANTMMWRSLITKRSRFPRQFVILKSTPVFLDFANTQTFIPDTLDSVPQAITPDTTLDTTQDTVALAVSILADRFVLICHICFRIHNWISTIYLSIIYRSLLPRVIHFLRT